MQLRKVRVFRKQYQSVVQGEGVCCYTTRLKCVQTLSSPLGQRMGPPLCLLPLSHAMIRAAGPSKAVQRQPSSPSGR